MKFFLAFLGALLLFFFGHSASAAEKTDHQVKRPRFAYAVYCDASVDRSVYRDQMVEPEENGNDIMVLTEEGYSRLMGSQPNYNDHCGPGVRVALDESL